MLEMFVFLKKIPICGVLNKSEKKKKKEEKENPTLWNTGKKVLKQNNTIYDGVKAMWS